MKAPQSVSLSFRVSSAKAKRIDKLAEATDRPKSWILEQAVDAYLDTQAWQVEHIKEGLESLRRGEVVDHEKVRSWLSTWGSERESKPPR